MEQTENLNLNKEKERFSDSRSWLRKKAEGPHARFWLTFLAFSDSAFFVIPPDVLLAPIVALFPKRWLWYANITILGSLIGGILGYLIGQFGYEIIGRPLIEFYNLSVQVEAVRVSFEHNAFWTIFVAAFTPIPYKVFTISAGFFEVNFLTFISASIIGRGLRYWILSYIVKYFGEKLGVRIHYYINLISIAIVGVIIVLLIFYFLL